MSVLTQICVEIDRIETAKASIKAAIEGKGVSVPSDTKIDGMAALISNISGGGSGTDLKTCTLTVRGEPTNYYPTDIAYTTVNDSGDIQYAYNSVSDSSITVTCLRNSIVAIKFKANVSLTSLIGVSPHLLFQSGSVAVIKIGDVENITIVNSLQSGGGDND